MLNAFSKKRVFYITFAFFSLVSSFSVIFFGIEHIENTVLYNTHLQALAVLSAAGLIDYFYINRIERSAVKHYGLIKKRLSENLLFIIIPFLLILIFWGSVVVFFIGIVLIRHFINLRRSVELIKGDFKLSYLTYLGQILRNCIVFIPFLELDIYLILFLLTFVFEILYIFFKRHRNCKQNRRISFKFKLLKADSFIYRFFYVGIDTLVRVVFPYFLTTIEAANYLYIVNMLLLPVAGYSLVGGIIHSYILRRKVFPELKVILSFSTILSVFLFIFYFAINLNENILVVLFLAITASLKFSDQILMSSNVSLGKFSRLKKINFLSAIFAAVLLLVIVQVEGSPLLFVIMASIFSSTTLAWYSYHQNHLNLELRKK